MTSHVSNECGCGPANRLEGIIWVETLAIQKLQVRESQKTYYYTKFSWAQEGTPPVQCKFLPKQEPSVLY